MRLTMQGEYAIRAMLELARRYDDGLMSAKELAAHQDIPSVFLTKILATLTKAGLVLSQRGSRGGIKLARQPSEISLQEIIEAIEGPLALNLCLQGEGACDRKPGCKAHDVWCRVQDAMRRELGITLDELIG